MLFWVKDWFLWEFLLLWGLFFAIILKVHFYMKKNFRRKITDGRSCKWADKYWKMWLFNSRKLTGRTIFICLTASIFSLYIFMIYIIIGLLVKASVFKINNTKISIAHMTVAEILADGCEIYVRQYEIPSRNY